MEYRKNKKLIDIKLILPNATNGKYNINFHHLIEREFSELLKKAKEIAKRKQYKFVWFKDSTVLARKTDDSPIIKIRSEDDLKNIV